MESKRRIACVYLSSRPEEFASLTEACLRFTPVMAVNPGEAIFLDITRSLNLFTEESFLARLHVLTRRFGKGLSYRVAIAESASAAFAMAKYPEYAASKNLRNLPLEALMDYASPFARNEELFKKIQKTIETFLLLGMRTVADFAILPPSGVATRFGKEILEISKIIWGEKDLAWPVVHLPPRIVERVNLDSEEQGPWIGLESLVFILRGLVDRAMARLCGRDERASAIQITLTLENWSTIRDPRREWLLELPVAQGSVAGLIPILQDFLGPRLEREPLLAPVRTVEFEILETVPGQSAQRDFFSRKEEKREAWEGLVGRLIQKLGVKERVFKATPVERYLPERGWTRLKAEAVPGVVSLVDLPPRPTRVLKKPEPLEKFGSRLVHLSGKNWNVTQWMGPERLAGEWWRDSKQAGFHRDYYRVLTETGEQLWVFLNRKAKIPTFYLHGFFD